MTSSDIDVVVDEGIVTLSGSVPHYAEKFAAERAVQRVEGVKAIAEEIKVHLGGVHQRPDSDVAKSVVEALKWHVWVPNHVQATVEKGWVTLRGTVERVYQRSAAEDAVKYLSGVKGINNTITLKPSVLPSEVKESIEKTLRRDAEIDARNISVTADGGEVTLAGSVCSWDEREEASSAAWGTPGVTDVSNDLAVLY